MISGGMLSKEAVQKPKYFVVTKAGFLHSLDSKFDATARESVPLHNVHTCLYVSKNVVLMYSLDSKFDATARESVLLGSVCAE